MKNRIYLLMPALLVLFLSSLFPDTGIALEQEDHNEKEITMDQVPAPVKEIIVKEANGNKIEETDVVCHGHYQVYTAEWIVDDMEVDISVVYMCKLVKKEIEPKDTEDEGDEENGEGDEEEDELLEKAVSFNQLPATVKNALAEAAGKNRISKIEEIVTKKGKFFEAEWIAGGWEYEIVLTEAGKLYRREMKIVNDDEDDDSSGNEDEDEDDGDHENEDDD